MCGRAEYADVPAQSRARTHPYIEYILVRYAYSGRICQTGEGEGQAKAAAEGKRARGRARTRRKWVVLRVERESAREGGSATMMIGRVALL